MQFLNAAALSAIVLSGFAAAQSLTVNTPGSLFQCQPGLLSWSGGVPPYFPRINQAGSTTVTIQQLPQTSSTSYTWTVNVAQGTTFTLAVADSTGAQQFSAVSPAVGAGSDSCLSANSTTGGGSSTTGSASSTTAAPGGSSTTTSSSSSSRPTSGGASSTSSSPPATSTGSAPNGAAKMQGYAAAAAGAVGVVVAALV